MQNLSQSSSTFYLNPSEQFARALGKGFQRIATDKPLIVVLDTYEIVDTADRYVRLIMHGAGVRLLWVIAGRNDLVNDRIYGSSYFKGYPDDFPETLVSYDMRRLAEADVKAYFDVKFHPLLLRGNVLSTFSTLRRYTI